MVTMPQTKINIMKLNKLFPISAMLLVLLMGSCTKEMDPNLSSGNSLRVPNQPIVTPGFPAAVNLGTAGNFAILTNADAGLRGFDLPAADTLPSFNVFWHRLTPR